MARLFLTLAALSAGLAVVAGAFGAHGFTATGDERAASLLKTGSQYQFGHALAVILAVMSNKGSNLPPALLLAGSLVFSFTLYGLAVGGPRWIGFVTPLGGLAMILGWLQMALCFWRSSGD